MRRIFDIIEKMECRTIGTLLKNISLRSHH